MFARQQAAGRVLAALLGIWLGTVLLSGAVAAVAFPVMKQLNPQIPTLAAAREPWMIAAGEIGRRGFKMAGYVQLAVGAGCLLAAFSAWGSRSGVPRAPRIIGICALIVSLGLLASSTWLQVRMNDTFEQHVAAVRANDLPKADALMATFQGMHPPSTRIMSGMAISVLLAMIAAACPARPQQAAP